MPPVACTILLSFRACKSLYSHTAHKGSVISASLWDTVASAAPPSGDSDTLLHVQWMSYNENRSLCRSSKENDPTKDNCFDHVCRIWINESENEQNPLRNMLCMRSLYNLFTFLGNWVSFFSCLCKRPYVCVSPLFHLAAPDSGHLMALCRTADPFSSSLSSWPQLVKTHIRDSENPRNCFLSA